MQPRLRCQRLLPAIRLELTPSRGRPQAGTQAQRPHSQKSLSGDPRGLGRCPPCPQPHGDSPEPSAVGIHHGQTSSRLIAGGQNPLRSFVHPRRCPERSWLTYRAAPARSRPDPAAGRRCLLCQLAASTPRPERGQTRSLHQRRLGRGVFPALGHGGGDGGVSPGWFPVAGLVLALAGPLPAWDAEQSPAAPAGRRSAGSRRPQPPFWPPACPCVRSWLARTWHG